MRLRPGLTVEDALLGLRLAETELELEQVFGRQVELRTYEDLSPYFREGVAAHARPLCAA